MKIGEASKVTGIGIETIRFYEREGLLKPEKLSSGYRVYSEELILKLKFIIQAKDLGFSLKEIKELLSLAAKKESQCLSVRNKTQTKLDEINKKINQLVSMKEVLEKLITSCEQNSTTTTCPILDAIFEEGERVE